MLFGAVLLRAVRDKYYYAVYAALENQSQYTARCGAVQDLYLCRAVLLKAVQTVSLLFMPSVRIRAVTPGDCIYRVLCYSPITFIVVEIKYQFDRVTELQLIYILWAIYSCIQSIVST